MTELRPEMTVRTVEAAAVKAAEGLHPELDTWLAIATENLCQEASERITGEIQAHYHDGLDALAGAGGTPRAAHDRVMEGLGDPEKAHKAFSRTYLTSWQDRFRTFFVNRLSDVNAAGKFLDIFCILVFLIVLNNLVKPSAPRPETLAAFCVIWLYSRISFKRQTEYFPARVNPWTKWTCRNGSIYHLRFDRSHRDAYLHLSFKKSPRKTTLFMMAACVGYCWPLLHSSSVAGLGAYYHVAMLMSFASLVTVTGHLLFACIWRRRWLQAILGGLFLAFLLVVALPTFVVSLPLWDPWFGMKPGQNMPGITSGNIFVMYLCLFLCSAFSLAGLVYFSVGAAIVRKAGAAMPAPEPEQETISDTNTPGCA